MDVNLASHAHQVPQVGCPHSEPVTIAKQVNINPNGAILLVIIIKFFVLKIKFAMESKAIQVKEAKPIQAEGT
jgi:hypothetical protein